MTRRHTFTRKIISVTDKRLDEDSEGMVRIYPKMQKVLSVQYRFDDEVKDDTHRVFTPEMLKLPQTTWIETFLNPERCYRQKYRTTPIQEVCLVRVQDLWCHVFSVCV